MCWKADVSQGGGVFFVKIWQKLTSGGGVVNFYQFLADVICEPSLIEFKNSWWINYEINQICIMCDFYSKFYFINLEQSWISFLVKTLAAVGFPLPNNCCEMVILTYRSLIQSVITCIFILGFAMWQKSIRFLFNLCNIDIDV